MIRHPHYLDIPWDVHWRHETTSYRHLWWMIALIIVLALFLVGVGATGGTL